VDTGSSVDSAKDNRALRFARTALHTSSPKAIFPKTPQWFATCATTGHAATPSTWFLELLNKMLAMSLTGVGIGPEVGQRGSFEAMRIGLGETLSRCREEKSTADQS
jgi:hypothetical protein